MTFQTCTIPSGHHPDGSFYQRVPVATLVKHIQPWETCPWDWSLRGKRGKVIEGAQDPRTLISKGEIARAVHLGDCQVFPWGPSTKGWHIRRIAYFVIHGWTDSLHIDVGVTGYNDWRSGDGTFLEDGNHRFYAAAYLGLESVVCTIGGDFQTMDRLGLLEHPLAHYNLD